MTAAEREVWNYVAPLAARKNLVDEIDHGALRRYCELSALYRRCKKEVGGVVTFMHETEHTKTQRLKPAASALLSIASELRQLEATLGFAPNARTSILARRADARDPEKPLSGPPQQPAAAPPPAAPGPQKPASPIGLLAGSARGPVN